MEYPPNVGELLRKTGYVDIQEQVVKLPYNTWPSDEHLSTIGRWYNLGFCEGLEALSLAPFTRVAGWNPGDVQRFIEDVKLAALDKRNHGYNTM
jgi:hypothetical protein